MNFKPSGLYTWTERFALPPATNGAAPGQLQVDYEVTRVDDARNLTSLHSYLVKCKQRTIIPNISADSFAPQVLTEYTYPIMFTNRMSIQEVDGNQGTWTLQDYSPKTLNSTVQTNASTSASSSFQTTAQQSTGTSTSDTSSYEVGGSIGPGGLSLSGSHGHSETTTSEQSSSSGTAAGRDIQVGSSDSMAIKNWAGYAALVPDINNPEIGWAWGQEFPWNIFRYHDTVNDESPAAVFLPEDVASLLGVIGSNPAQTMLFAPSDISLFGPNFVSSATWLFTITGAQLNPHDVIRFKHDITCWLGMHTIYEGADVKAMLQKAWDFSASATTTPSTASVDLGLLALDPIPARGDDSGAIVGFASSQFIALPGNAQGFSIKATANTLFASGTGFTNPVSNDAVMTADVTSGMAVMTVYFKVEDADRELSLYFKHWKATDAGCKLTIEINPSVGAASPRKGTSDPITIYIDANEASSGSDNISEVILRKKDYSSIEFYDYLNIGLNSIRVTISSLASSPTPSIYAIRALSIN